MTPESPGALDLALVRTFFHGTHYNQTILHFFGRIRFTVGTVGFLALLHAFRLPVPAR